MDDERAPEQQLDLFDDYIADVPPNWRHVGPGAAKVDANRKPKPKE